MRFVFPALLLTIIAGLLSATAADETPTTAPTTLPTVSVTLNLDPASLPKTPGYHLIKPTLTFDGKSIPFPCGIYLPAEFFKSDSKLPVVIGLHNKVAIGANYPEALTGEALGFALIQERFDGRASGVRPANPVWLPKTAPFVALIPECPGGYLWESPVMATVIQLLVDRAIEQCRGDRDRVYLTGFSYGGSSTWVIASALPDVFAAIAPIDGRATKTPADTVARLKRTAVYMVVGGSDKDFLPEAQRMRDALCALPHPNFVSRIVAGGNHFCYSMVYADPLFWDWMLAQRRPPPEKKPVRIVPSALPRLRRVIRTIPHLA